MSIAPAASHATSPRPQGLYACCFLCWSPVCPVSHLPFPCTLSTQSRSYLNAMTSWRFSLTPLTQRLYSLSDSALFFFFIVCHCVLTYLFGCLSISSLNLLLTPVPRPGLQLLREVASKSLPSSL